MSPLPLPVRIAAGLAATAVDQARQLPTRLFTLPVTVVSRALQTGMRVQQHVTELAIRGDEVFAHLRRTDDTPSWVRFEEDGADGTSLATVLNHPGSAPPKDAPRGPTDTGEVDEADVARALSPGSDDPVVTSDGAQPDTTALDRPAGEEAAPEDRAANGAASGDPAADDTAAEDIAPDETIADGQRGAPNDTAAPDPPAPTPTPTPTPTVPPSVGSSPSSSGPPPAMPGYDTYSLPQLRAKLRTLSIDQLEALLAHEQSHQDRAPFVTMLSNRITTVRSR